MPAPELVGYASRFYLMGYRGDRANAFKGVNRIACAELG